MKKGKFIIVEGIDGAGKSTITSWISKNYNFKIHKTPYGPFAEASYLFNADRVKPQERFSFYCGENIRASQFVFEQINEGINIIIDRYYLSTISYHASLYPDIYNNYKEIFKVLLKPDLAIIVYTDFDKIKSRLAGQDLEANDKFYLHINHFKSIYDSLYLATDYLNIKNCTVDNNFSFEETENQLIAVMKKM